MKQNIRHMPCTYNDGTRRCRRGAPQSGRCIGGPPAGQRCKKRRAGLSDADRLRNVIESDSTRRSGGLNVAGLRQACTARGLPADGRREALVRRLRQSAGAHEEGAPLMMGGACARTKCKKNRAKNRCLLSTRATDSRLCRRTARGRCARRDTTRGNAAQVGGRFRSQVGGGTRWNGIEWEATGGGAYSPIEAQLLNDYGVGAPPRKRDGSDLTAGEKATFIFFSLVGKSISSRDKKRMAKVVKLRKKAAEYYNDTDLPHQRMIDGWSKLCAATNRKGPSRNQLIMKRKMMRGAEAAAAAKASNSTTTTTRSAVRDRNNIIRAQQRLREQRRREAEAAEAAAADDSQLWDN